MNRKWITAGALCMAMTACTKEQPFLQDRLEATLQHGPYAMIESTPGSSTALPEEQRQSRFEHLDTLLTRAGYPHRQITGSYEGVVTKYSFLALNKPGNPIEKFKQEMFSLGCEFQQDSIILSIDGVNHLVFTRGENRGRSFFGTGFEPGEGGDFSEVVADSPSPSTPGRAIRVEKYRLDREHPSDVHPEFRGLLDSCPK